MGYHKTRLIAVLDRLHARGLVSREPAPEDRRARTVKLTRRGQALLNAVQRDIHQMEDELLSPDERLLEARAITTCNLWRLGRGIARWLRVSSAQRC